MAILDTLPQAVRKYRTRSDAMLRERLWAWQAVTAAAEQTDQASYLSEDHLVTPPAIFFDNREAVV